MSTNMYKKYTESLTREWPVASGTLAGVVVLHPVSAQVGVTLTARGDATESITLPNGITIAAYPVGGIGNKPGSATVAVDGSWLLPVTGVTPGDTNAATGGGTPSGTEVYRNSTTGALSLTASGGSSIGRIDDGLIVGTTTPVLIGIA